ncbi:hypothetical protein V1J52_11075 [Streptomyces sp. TRM 70351]|uniref:hypothetical protein n=1 Tax=Streptomyces sp. TRM 70351 TaxID=3116552 RepID=UPI002E7AC9C4|nr:hypothetical protein [Streptomyces sp. TRM 70351]MEE1928731.1 hypothetical protein [Streptomyces sp. TRM 70351]
MRRARMAVAATAAGAALSLLGTGVASAGSGPAPSPQERAATEAAGAAGTEAGNPRSAVATASGVCSDAYQIGSTAYVYRNTETIASVKQFYSPSCDENYGYTWVWQSFLDQDINFDLVTGVWSYDRDYLVGKRLVIDTHAQEFWSNAADTVNECTSGYGQVTILNEASYDVRSEQRC